MIKIEGLWGRMGNKMFQLAYLYDQWKKGNIPDMYLQDYQFFKDSEKDLMDIFGTGVGYLSQVAIHVRRGDYVGNPFYFDLIETDYYERAMERFPNKNFIVFSDDPDFCLGRKIFQSDRVQILGKHSEVSDFNLMASCESQIIANSSFSYWAAIVNPNPAKKVVAPLRWFSDPNKKKVGFPPDWILL